MRKTKLIKIAAEGRDKGKLFIVSEKSAAEAEWWATRALLALGKAGADLGDTESLGMQKLATIGLTSLMKVDPLDLRPLLDEIMGCVQIITDPNNVDYARPLMINSTTGEDDIEELSTYVRLRSEVFELHTGFSIPVAGPTSGSETGSTSSSSPTPTSPPASGRSSAQGRQR